MSAVTRSLRTASKQLRIQPRAIVASAPLVTRSSSSPAAAAATKSASAFRSFTSSAARASGAAPEMSKSREYDPEIRDIADYVANKPIDSELAVSSCPRN